MVFSHIALQVFLVVLVFNTKLSGQKALYLVPSLGIQFPQSHISDQGTAEATFSANYLNPEPMAGCSILMDLNQFNSISTGIIMAQMGTSYQYGFTPDGHFYQASVLRTLYVFPFEYLRKIGTANWVKSSRRSELIDFIKNKGSNPKILPHLFNIRIYVKGGVSYYHRLRQTGDNLIYQSPFDEAWEVNKLYTRHNAALFAGLKIQFYNFKRNSFQVEFLYSRGLILQETDTINYRFEGLEYNHRVVLGTRGSYFSLQLGYPIRLWKEKIS